MSIQLEIVTPTESAYSGPVETVTIPGLIGELGVLEQHAPLVTTIKPGELRYMVSGTEHSLAIGDGFVEVTPDKVHVVTDMAAGEADIDEAATEEAIKRAEEAMKGDHTDEEVALLEATIARSIAKLELKRRRKRI